MSDNPSGEERSIRLEVLFKALMEGHEEDEWDKSKDKHKAAHNYLASHMDELKLFDGANLIHEAGAVDRITVSPTEEAVRYEPTPLGVLVTALVCSWTNFFAERFESLGIGMGISNSGVEKGMVFMVESERLAAWLVDLVTASVRVGLAHRDGKLDKFYDARTELIPEILRNWMVAEGEDEKEATDE